MDEGIGDGLDNEGLPLCSGCGLDAIGPDDDGEWLCGECTLLKMVEADYARQKKTWWPLVFGKRARNKVTGY